MRFWLVIVAFGFSGCATILGHDPLSEYVRGVDWPLTDIRSVVSSKLPIGLAKMSSNGRVLSSMPFLPGPKSYRDAKDAPVRFRADVKLLGTGRPYDIEITVYRERRTSTPNYTITLGVNRDLTREVKVMLEAELTKRREDRNVIDDFRVF